MIGVLAQQPDQPRKALRVQVLHTYAEESVIFEDDHLVSLAGLVPVMTLAEQTQLPAETVSITAPRIASGSANPGPKLATVIAGMCAGADSIDDIDLVRSGGMRALLRGLRALHDRHSAAGVHLRASPPTGIGTATTPGRPVRAGRPAA